MVIASKLATELELVNRLFMQVSWQQRPSLGGRASAAAANPVSLPA